MLRRLLMLAAAIVAASTIGTIHAATAQATCIPDPQLATTYAQDDGTNWIVGVSGSSLNVSCSQQWRVEFKPQYRAGGVWHLGINDGSKLCEPNEGCGTPSFYPANVAEVFTPGVTPAAFTGYWDNGDGSPPRPVCDYRWRVHESYWTSGGVKIDDLYSPMSTGVCS